MVFARPQAFARGDWHTGPFAEVAQGRGVVQLHLEPRRRIRLDRPSHAQRALGAEIGAEVHQQLHLARRARAQGRELFAQCALEVRRRSQCWRLWPRARSVAAGA